MARKGGKSGVNGVLDDAGGYAGDLVEPLAMLVGGASKASVAWTAFKNVWMTKVLGPVGMLTGAAMGATVAMAKLGRAMADAGMKGAANMETLTVSFKALLKGMESATKRMQELASFSAKSPFRLDEIAEGSRILETLTRGALSTEKGLKLVADAAATTGRTFGEMATWVGRLYDGLQSGRPVGEVAQQLQAVGVLSGTARSEMESLIESGKAGNEVWRIAERELSRMSGASEDLSRTLDGLQSTLADNKAMFEAAFSQGYLDGEKAGVEALAGAYEKLTPLAKDLGEEFGAVSNLYARFKAMISQKVAVPVLTAVGSLIAKIGATSVLAVTGASVAKIAQSLMGMGAAAGGAKAGTAAVKTLGSAFMDSVEAVKLFVTGDKAGAASMAATARQGAVSAVNLGRNAGAMGVLTGAAKAAGAAMKFLGRQMAGAFLSALTQPVVLIAAALAGATMAWQSYARKQEEAAAKVKGINDALKEQNALLTEQLANVKSVADLNAYYATVTDRLSKAYGDLLDAQREQAANPLDANLQKNLEGRQKIVEMLERQAKAGRNIKEDQLEKDATQDQTGQKLARAQAAQDIAFREKLATASPEERAKMLAERAQRTGQIVAGADQDEVLRRTGQRTSAFIGADKAAVSGRIKALREQIAAMKADMPAEKIYGDTEGNDAGIANPAYEVTTKAIAQMEEALAAASEQQRKLNAEQARGAQTELQALRDQIALIDAYNQARVEASKDGAPFAAKARRDSLRDSLFAALPGVNLSNLSGKRQELQQRQDFLGQRNQQAREDQAAQQAEAQREALQLVLNVQQDLLDIEQAQVSARADSLQRTMELLALEDRRTELLQKQGRLSATEAAARKASTAGEREAAARREAADLAERAIAAQETLVKGEDDSLERELKLLNLARQRLQVTEGLSEAQRKAAMGQLDAEEKIVRQQYAKRDAAAKLDKEDAQNAMKYRGAEREKAAMETERRRIQQDSGATAAEKEARMAGLDARQKDFATEQGKIVKRALIDSSIGASERREDRLRDRGNESGANRERQRRVKDERERARMEAEERSESIADPEKRKKYVKDQMNAFEDATKADIQASRSRKAQVQAAQEAYEKWIRLQKEFLKTYLRIGAQQSRTAADMDDYYLQNAKAFKGMGIMVDEAAQFAKKQKDEEDAAFAEEKIKVSELIDQYLSDGFDQATATKMAQDQMNADRNQRAVDRKQEKVDFLMSQLSGLTSMDGRTATAVSSMRALGGGGAAYGPGGAAGSDTAQIKQLVQQIKELLAQEPPYYQTVERMAPLSS